MKQRQTFGALAACVLALVLVSSTTAKGQDLTTLLSLFLRDLYSGYIGTSTPITGIRVGNGSAAAPSMSFASETGLGFYRYGTNTIGVGSAGATGRMTFGSAGIELPAAGIIGWSASTDPGASLDASFCRGGTNVIGIGGCTSSFPALKRSTTQLQARLGDDSADAPFSAGSITTSGNFAVGANSSYVLDAMFVRRTAPTISSGFGTSPSIVASNGTAAFTINVGTGGVATSGVIGLPAATTGWAVSCANTSTNTATVFITKQTAFTTTTATIGNYDAAGAAAAWTASNVLVCHAHAF